MAPRVMRAVLGAGAAVLAAVSEPPASAPGANGAEKTKIVLMWTARDHPWGSHMYEHECRLLAKCLNQTPGVEAVVSPDPEWPKDAAVLAGAKAIVYYSRQAGDIVLDGAHRAEFKKMMDAGVGFCAIHWATKAEDPKLLPEYLDVLGGAFHTGPEAELKIDTRPLVQAEPDHAVCRGWKGYDLHDEFYLNLKFHERARAVLRVNVEGKDQTVAWVFERAAGGAGGKDAVKGRSFGTTLGHFHENFGIEAFRRAIVNGILWSAHVEVPAAGAPVALDDVDLRLGPEPGKEGK